MIQSILGGVTKALSEEFGEEYEIYIEPIEQDLKEPCFFVSCADSSMNRFRGDVYRADYCIMVLYFPATSEIHEECSGVADRLWLALEIIDTDRGRRLGSNMQAEVRDGVLNFNLSYSQFLRKTETGVNMEHLESSYRGE